jgi:hypothetical protein
LEDEPGMAKIKTVFLLEMLLVLVVSCGTSGKNIDGFWLAQLETTAGSPEFGFSAT